MAVSNQFREIVSRLLAASAEKRVAWRETGGMEEYAVALTGYLLTISTNPFITRSGRHSPVTLKLQSSDGREIASCEILEGDNDYQRLSQLHDIAKEQAKRVDDMLKRVEEQLGRPGPIGIL